MCLKLYGLHISLFYCNEYLILRTCMVSYYFIYLHFCTIGFDVISLLCYYICSLFTQLAYSHGTLLYSNQLNEENRKHDD